MTLTEVAIVILLASIVMTGLVTFYLNSQVLWVDGSGKAITQREATLVLQEIGRRARSAASAEVAGDPLRATLILHMDASGPREYRFEWHADSLIYELYRDSVGVSHDLGAMLQSRVEFFAVSANDRLVNIDSLRILTPQNTRVMNGLSIAMRNRPTP